MSDRKVSFSELASESLIEVGAGRPRTVLDQYPSLPILRVADVLDGRIESPPQDSDSGGYHEVIEPKISRPGDVVLTVKGTVGRVGLMPSEGPNFAYSPQICYFRPSANGPLRTRYLYYWFKSSAFWNQADALKGQTDMADYLSLTDVQALEISLPSLDRQDRIIEVLGSIDDKIAVNERIVNTSHELAQVHLLQPRRNTDLRSLAQLAEITMGSAPPGESYNEVGTGMPFYQGTRDFGARFPSRRVWSTSPGRVAQPGSTLISVRAPVGRVNIATELCCIGRGVAAVKSREGTPSVLFHELAATSDVWRPFESEGTVFGAINKHQLENIEIQSVGADAAKILEELLGPLDRRVAIAFSENDDLADLRDALLPKLMSGEMCVRDAEKIVEDVT